LARRPYAALNRSKHYPEAARARGESWPVRIAITIGRGGRVPPDRIIGSSGWRQLTDKQFVLGCFPNLVLADIRSRISRGPIFETTPEQERQNSFFSSFCLCGGMEASVSRLALELVHGFQNLMMFHHAAFLKLPLWPQSAMGQKGLMLVT
jgi:hypothetical protein